VVLTYLSTKFNSVSLSYYYIIILKIITYKAIKLKLLTTLLILRFTYLQLQKQRFTYNENKGVGQIVGPQSSGLEKEQVKCQQKPDSLYKGIWSRYLQNFQM